MMVGVKAATTANHGLTGTSSVDGVSMSAGMKVLVWKQTTTTANGIYKVTASGTWTKVYAFDSSKDAVTGANVGMVAAVAGGTLYGKTFIQWNGSTAFVQMGGYYI